MSNSVYLSDLRQEIDAIDDRLVELLEKRLEVSGKIAEYKLKHELPVFDQLREIERINAVRAQASEALEPYIATLWRTIMDVSKDYQDTIVHPALFGLVGQTLAHSYSSEIHKRIADYPYELYEVEPEELQDFLVSGPLAGCNVTIPYKELAYQYCDELSTQARRIGCVNTIVRQADGTLYGDNTDYQGFLFMLDLSGIQVQGAKVCIFGTGGASKTVHAVVEDLGAACIVHVARSVRAQADVVTYDQTQYYLDADVVINTTPVGMYPQCPDSVVDLAQFTSLHGVLDVVYNPVRTGLILQAEKLGIPHAGGLSMLVVQAMCASRVFGVAVAESIDAKALISAVRSTHENIVLIGMPGAGKTHIGQVLATYTGRDCVDIDEVFTLRYALTPAEYIMQYGQEVFREQETCLLKEFGAHSASVIVCGGGVVTQPENYQYLRQNGRIVYIQRDANALEVTGRPLSESIGVEELFRSRQAAYESWADITVVNNDTPETCVACILSALEREV